MAAGLVLAVLVAAALQGGAGRADFASLLRVGQPILEADRLLQERGWRPAPERPAGALDRERAGNGLASLSACSGVAAGLCRYDYRRDTKGRRNRLAVITWRAGAETPAASDPDPTTMGLTTEDPTTATVLRWSDEGPGGGRWGLCQAEDRGALVPCDVQGNPPPVGR